MTVILPPVTACVPWLTVIVRVFRLIALALRVTAPTLPAAVLRLTVTFLSPLATFGAVAVGPMAIPVLPLTVTLPRSDIELGLFPLIDVLPLTVMSRDDNVPDKTLQVESPIVVVLVRLLMVRERLVADPDRDFTVAVFRLAVRVRLFTVTVQTPTVSDWSLRVTAHLLAAPVLLLIVTSPVAVAAVLTLLRNEVFVTFGSRYFAMVRVYRNVWMGTSPPLEVAFLPPL